MGIWYSSKEVDSPHPQSRPNLWYIVPPQCLPLYHMQGTTGNLVWQVVCGVVYVAQLRYGETRILLFINHSVGIIIMLQHKVLMFGTLCCNQDIN